MIVSCHFSFNCMNDTRNPLHVESAVTQYTCLKGEVWHENNTTWKTNESMLLHLQFVNFCCE